MQVCRTLRMPPRPPVLFSRRLTALNPDLPSALLWRREFVHYFLQIEARRPLADGVLLKSLQPLRNYCDGPIVDENSVHEPVVVQERRVAPLEGIGAQIENLRYAECFVTLHPNIQTFMILLDEDRLPAPVTNREEVAIVAPIEKILSRRILHLTLEVRNQVVAIQVDVKGFVIQLAAGHALPYDIAIASRGRESGKQILMREEIVIDGACLDCAGPANKHRHAITAFPVCGFFAAIWRGAAVWPGHIFVTVVRGVDNDGVVRDSQVI